MRTLLISFVVVHFLYADTAFASIYKCDNGQGQVVYNDKPCPKGIVETKIKAVKAPTTPYIPEETKIQLKENKNNSVVVGSTINKKDADATNERDLSKDEGLGNSAQNNGNEKSAEKVNSKQSKNSQLSSVPELKQASQTKANDIIQPPGIIE